MDRSERSDVDSRKMTNQEMLAALRRSVPAVRVPAADDRCLPAFRPAGNPMQKPAPPPDLPPWPVLLAPPQHGEPSAPTSLLRPAYPERMEATMADRNASPRPSAAACER